MCKIPEFKPSDRLYYLLREKKKKKSVTLNRCQLTGAGGLWGSRGEGEIRTSYLTTNTEPSHTWPFTPGFTHLVSHTWLPIFSPFYLSLNSKVPSHVKKWMASSLTTDFMWQIIPYTTELSDDIICGREWQWIEDNYLSPLLIIFVLSLLSSCFDTFPIFLRSRRTMNLLSSSFVTCVRCLFSYPTSSPYPLETPLFAHLCILPSSMALRMSFWRHIKLHNNPSRDTDWINLVFSVIQGTWIAIIKSQNRTEMIVLDTNILKHNF